MIIGLSLIHVQFLLVWANNGWILVQSIQWLDSLLFVLDVYSLREKKNELDVDICYGTVHKALL